MKESRHPSPTRLGDALAGLIVLMAGTVFLLEQTGTYLPDWLTSWPMIPLTVGLIIGAKTLFKGPPVWLMFTGFGAVYLIDQIMPGLHVTRLVWPTVVILFALWIMLGRKLHRKDYRQEHARWAQWEQDFHNQVEPRKAPTDSRNRLEAISAFGACQMHVLSKNWKGGEVITFFGGAEIDLSQADIQGTVFLEVIQIFGGTKLVVPSHWEVISSEMVAVFGGIEDKRMRYKPAALPQDKVLVLSGTAVFAGIELVSYS